MTTINRTIFACAASVLMSTAGAFAADLYGGSMKDGGGYVAPQSGRPALFYLRGDLIASSNDFGSINELPNYTESNTHIGNSRAWGAGFGMHFSPNVRGDLTLDWSSTAAINGDVVDGAATVQGTRQFGVKHLVGLANVYYDFDMHSRFTPYLGVGLGFSRNTTTAGSVSIVGCDAAFGGAASNCAANMDGKSKISAAGALMAGFTTKLADRWSIDAGYRFVYVGDANTDGIQITRIVNNPAWPQSTSGMTVRDMYEHQLRVGLRMDLGGAR